jgi:aryl sulfotransferase
MTWFGAVAGVALLCVVVAGYLIWYFHWEEKNTAGMAYYGRSPEARRAFKARVRLLSKPMLPAVHLLAVAGRQQRTMPAVDYDGVWGPPKVSSPDTFLRARHYRPRPEDVFVATQMRSGTTWMQQLVYQVVTRGRGGFNDPRRSNLYAISPWIEGANSVSVADAPVVGARPARIIKTHLPASHCPYDASAKYIYVARHPVACFASIVDFTRTMAGPLVPPIENMAAWFTSDRMYWLPWPIHVDGWWQLAQRRENVLFVHFDEMTRDLPAVIDRLAALLAVPLTPQERLDVASRCTFDYMTAHGDCFEMAPPTMFSVAGGRFLKRGSARRDEDVTPAIRRQILGYCRHSLSGRPYPAERFFTDLAN